LCILNKKEEFARGISISMCVMLELIYNVFI